MTNKVIERLKEGPRPGTTIFRALNSITWSFRYDDESGGVYAVDQGGFLLTRDELMDLIEGSEIFFDFHGDDGIEQFNKDKLEKTLSHEPTSKEPVERKPRHGWVYIVRGKEDEYKIGMTAREPGKRLAEFTPKLPFATELIITIESDDALGLESYIHSMFDDERINGEWFKLTEPNLEWIRRLA